MREEFYAGLEDRKYLALPEAQKKGLQVGGRQGRAARQRRRQGGSAAARGRTSREWNARASLHTLLPGTG